MCIKKHDLSHFYESSYHFLHKNTKFNCTNPFYQFLCLTDVEVSCHTNLKTLTNGQKMLLWGLNVKIFIYLHKCLYIWYVLVDHSSMYQNMYNNYGWSSLGDRCSMFIKRCDLSHFYESSYHFLYKNTKFNIRKL